MDLEEIIDEVVQRLGVMLDEKLAAIKTTDQPERLLTPAEASKIFGVVPKTIRSWHKQGLLESKSVGRRVYYKHSDLIAAGKTLKKYKR